MRNARCLVPAIMAGVLLGTTALALADVAPLPWPRPDPQPEPQPQPSIETMPVPLDAATHVEMKTAAVVVQVKQAPPAREVDMVSLWSLILRGIDVPDELLDPVEVPQLQATVTATFVMACTAARNPTADFTMGFPVCTDGPVIFSLEDDTVLLANVWPEVSTFAARTDGKLMAAKSKAWWTKDADGQPIYCNGYSWPATIKRGSRQTIVVQYTMLLPLRDGWADLPYVLRSGAEWYGTIGHETVLVRADKGITMEPAQGTSLTCTKKADGSLLWDIKNLDPTEDVHVKLSLEPTEDKPAPVATPAPARKPPQRPTPRPKTR